MKKEKISFVDEDWTALNQFLEKKNYSQIFVLVDSNTLENCLPIFSAGLRFEFHILEIEPGEESKDLQICAHLWQELTDLEVDRNAVFINLGGGVVSDLGGFVAGVYKRGIDFIHVPTSLLAMIDASIGGKCGIDFQVHKNQLGLFKQAREIFVFQNFLQTLPLQELKSGFAEMIKHALVFDHSYWQEISKIIQVKADRLMPLIEKSMLIKNAIVSLDPLEKGERKKLNFGHTIGHAIESYFLQKEEPIPHGYAIAAGMYLESYLSLMNKLIDYEEFSEIADFIQGIYTKLLLDEKAIEFIIKQMKQDKKRKANLSQFTLLSGLGQSEIEQICSDRQVKMAFQYYHEQYSN